MGVSVFPRKHLATCDFQRGPEPLPPSGSARDTVHDIYISPITKCVATVTNFITGLHLQNAFGVTKWVVNLAYFLRPRDD